MGKTVIASDAAPVGGPYSPGLAVGGWVFLAGQTGSGDTIEEQLAHIFTKLTILLGEAGATLADVVSCQVHLSDLALFPRLNTVYQQNFPEPRPVRTTVGAALIGDALVELTVIARPQAG